MISLRLLFIFILSLSALNPAAGACGLSDTCDSESSAAGPRLETDSSCFDFGDIPQGERRTHSFLITNSGDTPLVITGVFSGCGCTKVEYDDSPLPPGESRRLTVSFDSAGRQPGSFTKLIRIRSNASDIPVRLYVKGRIK